MPTTYTLTTIGDLLMVPIERREDCVNEILLALALHELAFGDGPRVGIGSMTWTDDGKHDIDLEDAAGKQVLGLRVTKAAA